ncbi:MAG TPA: hypothetical protein VJC39_02520 [Candidatus Nanoarchaeia archaeon]|nr:hypothetical protein [Candidatus Nanoarchaeia archaeon]
MTKRYTYSLARNGKNVFLYALEPIDFNRSENEDLIHTATQRIVDLKGKVPPGARTESYFSNFQERNLLVGSYATSVAWEITRLKNRFENQKFEMVQIDRAVLKELYGRLERQRAPIIPCTQTPEFPVEYKLVLEELMSR